MARFGQSNCADELSTDGVALSDCAGPAHDSCGGTLPVDQYGTILGVTAPDDFSLRVSAVADGQAAVDALLGFADELAALTQ